ncbi:2'-5' RNA ligase family protein [Saccharopolyspora sp. NPDC050389]|uniref:2'-5' RNA ligase family protein n=1 Tax=Saccharopolyspora sp. NPDC050389 TaxID=3155516 RepID=UPI0033D04B3E
MDNFFRRHPMATWPAPQRLHIYATPVDQRLRATVERYQDALRPLAAEHGLGLLPPEWQHLTVQSLGLTRSEVSASEHAELAEKLSKAVSQVDPISLVIGPPQVSRHAIELWVHPAADEPWSALVGAVRREAADVLGADTLPPLGANGRPHTAIAYGIGRGDSGVLTSALQQVRTEPVAIEVRQVRLVAVTQHPSKGWFTWDSIADLPLAAG